MSARHSLLGYLFVGVVGAGFLWHTVRVWANWPVERWEIRWTRRLLTGLYGQLLLGALLLLLTDAGHMPSPLHPWLGLGVVVLARAGLPIQRNSSREFHGW